MIRALVALLASAIASELTRDVQQLFGKETHHATRKTASPKTILCFVPFLRGPGNARFRHAPRVQRTTAKPRLRIAPVPRKRGQNGCSDSPLRQSHRRDLPTSQHEEYCLLVARGCAEFAKPVRLHSRASQPQGSGEELGCFSSRSGMAEGKSRIGGKWSAGRPYRPVFYGSDDLFSAQVVSDGPSPIESSSSIGQISDSRIDPDMGAVRWRAVR